MEIENETYHENLLEEYKQNRKEIQSMIKEIEEIKESVNLLIPKQLEKRYARLLEEKIKAISQLFGTILDMRKEISKSIKDEFDMRRKLQISDDKLEDNIDVEEIAKKIESFKKNVTLIKGANKK